MQECYKVVSTKIVEILIKFLLTYQSSIELPEEDEGCLMACLNVGAQDAPNPALICRERRIALRRSRELDSAKHTNE